jgi:hypothetical protein
MPRIKKVVTDPGATDDDAIKRARDRMKKMEQLGAKNDAGRYTNPVDAAGEELAYTEPRSVQRIFES